MAGYSSTAKLRASSARSRGASGSCARIVRAVSRSMPVLYHAEKPAYGVSMELSVLNLYNLLVRNRLLAESDALAMFQRWRKEAKDANDPGQFSQWIVGQGIVTPYQAS